MKTSTTFQKVFEAMAQARTEMPAIAMDADNPYFKSKYAPLGTIMTTIQPTLDKYKLSIVHTLEGDGVTAGVTTRVTHYESGEWIESTAVVPLKGASEKTQIVQVAGIDFTYLRRYNINAMFNLIAEEDTDGNLGYERPAKQVYRPNQKPSVKAKVKAKRNEPIEPDEPEDEPEGEETEEDKIASYEAEFETLYNRARALGNEKDDLPKPEKSMTALKWLEKIAEISLIIKESESE